MTNSCVRIRVQLDTTPISFPKQCWLLFDLGSCRIVGDVARLISERFEIHGPNGLQLYLDDFLLPMNEDAAIVRDNDRIQVRTVDHRKSSVPVVTSVDNTPLVTTSVADGISEPCKAKKHKKRKRKDSALDEVAFDNGQAVESKDDVAVEEQPSGFKKRKRKTRSRSSPVSTEEVCMPVPVPAEGKAVSDLNAKKTDDDSIIDAVPAILPQPNKKKLHSITTKTTTGSLHVRFHSDTSHSEDEEETATSAKKPKVASSAGKGTAKQPEVDGPIETTSKSPNTNLQHKPKQKKSRRKKLSPDTIVGGSDDIFTTKTSVYISSDQGEAERQQGTKEMCSSLHNHQQEMETVEDVAEPVSNSNQRPCTISSGSGSILQPAKRNYDALSDLRGPPRVGDRIAFKLLELSVHCTPEVSSYKEGRVLSISSDMVQIELSEESTQQQKEISEESALAKFRLPDSDQSGEDEENLMVPSQPDALIELPLEALLQPKLL